MFTESLCQDFRGLQDLGSLKLTIYSNTIGITSCFDKKSVNIGVICGCSLSVIFKRPHDVHSDVVGRRSFCQSEKGVWDKFFRSPGTRFFGGDFFFSDRILLTGHLSFSIVFMKNCVLSLLPQLFHQRDNS